MGPAIACLFAYGAALVVAILVASQMPDGTPIWTALVADIAATL